MKIISLLRSLTKIEREVLEVTLLIVLISGIFWINRVFYKNTIPEPAFGGRYQEGIIGQPIYINPVIATNDADRDITELIFASLADLTEKTEMSEDQKNWSITLKEKAFWSDG